MARIRAIADEEKVAKRRTILDAAMKLYQDKSYELPSVSAIAKESGLAKGTVYLYFKTKEEIFIVLLEEGFTLICEGISAAITDADECDPGFISKLVHSYTDMIRNYHGFLTLAAMTNSVLEQNLDLNIALTFKKKIAYHLQILGAQLESKLPRLQKGAGAKMLLHIYSLTVGLWQTLNCPKKIRPMMGDEVLGIFNVEYFKELRGVLMMCVFAFSEVDNKAKN